MNRYFFNSIFRKQYIIYLSVIIITFLVLGVALSRAFEAHFTEQTVRELVRQGEQISRQYARVAFSAGGVQGMMNLSDFYDQLRVLNDDLAASFILVDTGFNILDVSADIDRSYIGQRLDPGVFEPVLQGRIITGRGQIEELYTEPVITVAYPIIAARTVWCAILMNSSLPQLRRSLSDAYRVLALCLIASACIAFVLLYAVSRRMFKPLRDMNEAAKIIAGGDFERRIITKSRDEIGQLADSLNHMAQSLQKQEAARRDFLANISHDFRSPLTNIKGFLRAIEDGTAPEEKHAYYLGVVIEETDRLSALAENILALNSVTFAPTQAALEEVDINALIKKTVLKLERRIKDKNIAVVLCFEDAGTVLADEPKIERVMYNLCDNAVKFTPPGGNITIETTALQESGRLKVSVSDTGPGIAPEDKARVFERFYKGDASRGTDKKGSGLGLAIAREFVKAHGDALLLETNDNASGCVFSFTLAMNI